MDQVFRSLQHLPYQDQTEVQDSVLQLIRDHPNCHFTVDIDTFSYTESWHETLLVVKGSLENSRSTNDVTIPISVCLWLHTRYPRQPPSVFIHRLDTLWLEPVSDLTASAEIRIPYLRNWLDVSNLSDLWREIKASFAHVTAYSLLDYDNAAKVKAAGQETLGILQCCNVCVAPCENETSDIEYLFKIGGELYIERAGRPVTIVMVFPKNFPADRPTVIVVPDESSQLLPGSNLYHRGSINWRDFPPWQPDNYSIKHLIGLLINSFTKRMPITTRILYNRNVAAVPPQSICSFSPSTNPANSDYSNIPPPLRNRGPTSDMCPSRLAESFQTTFPRTPQSMEERRLHTAVSVSSSPCTNSLLFTFPNVQNYVTVNSAQRNNPFSHVSVSGSTLQPVPVSSVPMSTPIEFPANPALQRMETQTAQSSLLATQPVPLLGRSTSTPVSYSTPSNQLPDFSLSRNYQRSTLNRPTSDTNQTQTEPKAALRTSTGGDTAVFPQAFPNISSLGEEHSSRRSFPASSTTTGPVSHAPRELHPEHIAYNSSANTNATFETQLFFHPASGYSDVTRHSYGLPGNADSIPETTLVLMSSIPSPEPINVIASSGGLRNNRTMYSESTPATVLPLGIPNAESHFSVNPAGMGRFPCLPSNSAGTERVGNHAAQPSVNRPANVFEQTAFSTASANKVRMQNPASRNSGPAHSYGNQNAHSQNPLCPNPIRMQNPHSQNQSANSFQMENLQITQPSMCQGGIDAGIRRGSTATSLSFSTPAYQSPHPLSRHYHDITFDVNTRTSDMNPTCADSTTISSQTHPKAATLSSATADAGAFSFPHTFPNVQRPHVSSTILSVPLSHDREMEAKYVVPSLSTATNASFATEPGLFHNTASDVTGQSGALQHSFRQPTMISAAYGTDVTASQRNNTISSIRTITYMPTLSTSGDIQQHSDSTHVDLPFSGGIGTPWTSGGLLDTQTERSQEDTGSHTSSAPCDILLRGIAHISIGGKRNSNGQSEVVSQELLDFARDAGLEPGSIQRLTKHGFYNLRSVLALEEKDLEELGLVLAQKALLRKALAKKRDN